MRSKVLVELLISMLAVTPLMAQHMPIDPETNRITYLAEVQLDTNISNSSIQAACQAWVSSYYKSEDQLKVNAKQGGRMYKSANFPVFRRMYGRGGPNVEGGFMQYTVSFIFLGKGRYIIAISDFKHTDPSTGRHYGVPEEFYAASSQDFAILKYYIDQMDAFSRDLLEQAKSYVESSAQ